MRPILALLSGALFLGIFHGGGHGGGFLGLYLLQLPPAALFVAGLMTVSTVSSLGKPTPLKKGFVYVAMAILLGLSLWITGTSETRGFTFATSLPFLLSSVCHLVATKVSIDKKNPPLISLRKGP